VKIITHDATVTDQAMRNLNNEFGCSVKKDTGNHILYHQRARDKRWQHQVTFAFDRHADVPNPDLFMLRGHRGRRTHKLCWHGHYELMRHIYLVDPDAEIRTCQTTYKDVSDFNANAAATGRFNAGSQAFPIEYRQRCDCGDIEELAS